MLESNFRSHGSYVELLGSPRVFMHDINTLPMFSNIISTVDEIEKYERVLAIARQDDIILTKNKPEKSYLKWLKSVGLGTNNILVVNGISHETLPERVVKNGLRKKIDQILGSNKENASFSPYYGGTLENNACNHLNLRMYANSSLVKKYDSKLNFKNLCNEVGVPVVEDVIIQRKMNHSEDNLKEILSKIQKLMNKTGKIIVKGEYGASGSTTKIFRDFNMLSLKNLIFNNNLCNNYVVEPLFDLASSPSSLWFISRDRSITHIKTSNQLLYDDGIVHAGNEFPVKFSEKVIKSLSFNLAKKLALEGFIGPFGIDFIETKFRKYYAVECNPRVTGANYPWELVHVLNQRHGSQDSVKSARAVNIHLNKKRLTFKDLMVRWKRVLYSGDCANGIIIPFNVGPVSSGKVTVLGTGTSNEEVNDLFKFLRWN